MKNYCKLKPKECLEIYEKGELVKGEYTYKRQGLLDRNILVAIFKEGKLLPQSFNFDIHDEMQKLNESKGKSVIVQSRIYEESYNKLKEKATEQNISLSEYIRQLIEKEIGE